MLWSKYFLLPINMKWDPKINFRSIFQFNNTLFIMKHAWALYFSLDAKIKNFWYITDQEVKKWPLHSLIKIENAKSDQTNNEVTQAE